ACPEYVKLETTLEQELKEERERAPDEREPIRGRRSGDVLELLDSYRASGSMHQLQGHELEAFEREMVPALFEKKLPSELASTLAFTDSALAPSIASIRETIQAHTIRRSWDLAAEWNHVDARKADMIDEIRVGFTLEVLRALGKGDSEEAARLA